MEAKEILELKDWKPRDVWYGFNKQTWNFTVPICEDPDTDKPTLIGQATPPQGYSSIDRIGLQFGKDGRLHITYASFVEEEEGRNKCEFYHLALEQKELTLPKELCLDMIKEAILRVLRSPIYPSRID